MKDIIISFIVKKLKEKSTQALIVTWIVGVFGYTITPEYTDEITKVCGAITAVIAIYLDDKTVVSKKKK